MRRETESPARLFCGLSVPLGALAALTLLTASTRISFAADEFQDLVRQIPRSANAVVLLNMEKAKRSPMGVKEDWSTKIEQAFEAGVARVPPQSTRFVLASEIDFEFMEPLWEAAVIEMDEDISTAQLEKMRGGTSDTIEGLPAIRRPNDTYIVQLAPKTIGAMGPANRQAVVRWLRDVHKSPPTPLSPYLQKAAVYSDKASSEIIMAIDLDGVLSPQRVAKYLKSKQKELDEWRADPAELSKLLSGVQGFRIGVRIGDEPTAKIVIDLQGDASKVSAFAKPLLLQVLADKGAMIDDFQSWTAKAEGNEISLAGKLSKSGLRKLMSVIDSPAPDNLDTSAAKPAPTSPGDLPNLELKASKGHFRAVVALSTDLKSDMRNAKNLASTSLWFDKYAKRIERMPTLNVDKELLDYSGFVANQLRQASLAVKTMGIQSGVRQAQITGVDPYINDGYGYGYGAYRYGAYGSYGSFGGTNMAALKETGQQRRVVRAEEKGIAATDVQKIRQDIIAATTDIRRKMTEKYQVQF